MNWLKYSDSYNLLIQIWNQLNILNNKLQDNIDIDSNKILIFSFKIKMRFN